MLPFFEWCEATWLGQLVRDSLWLFPVIEAVHLLGLCLLGGAVLIVDLRLLGLGLNRQPIAQLARGARPWMLAGLAMMLSTGVLLFLSEAVKCYHSPAFRVKMTALPIALLFTFLLRQPFALNDASETSLRSRTLAMASVALWFTVAAAGRWIGFSS